MLNADEKSLYKIFKKKEKPIICTVKYVQIKIIKLL